MYIRLAGVGGSPVSPQPVTTSCHRLARLSLDATTLRRRLARNTQGDGVQADAKPGVIMDVKTGLIRHDVALARGRRDRQPSGQRVLDWVFGPLAKYVYECFRPAAKRTAVARKCADPTRVHTYAKRTHARTSHTSKRAHKHTGQHHMSNIHRPDSSCRLVWPITSKHDPVLRENIL